MQKTFLERVQAMRMSRNLCMLAMAGLTALAVTLVGIGCGDQEAAPTTPETQAAV